MWAEVMLLFKALAESPLDFQVRTFTTKQNKTLEAKYGWAYLKIPQVNLVSKN